MPQASFAFEFEWERLNRNSATKELPNYHSSVLEKSVKWLNDNLATASEVPFDRLYPNLMNGIFEVFRKHVATVL